MRLVAVSIVKNEADVIEPFVRHAAAWVDHHLIFDHDSTDGTRELLAALQAEGLPLTLFTDDALSNLQQARSNFLTQLAATEFGADWILPLDADEFLAGSTRAELARTLAELDKSRPASLFLQNYYPTADDDLTVANPALRLRHISKLPAQTKKLFLPRALVLDPAVVTGKGSHQVFRADALVPDQALPAAWHLAHLALRSPQHQCLRVVLAELQKLSRGRAHAGLDLHYRLGYQLLAENPARFFSTIYQPASELVVQPIAYRGGALRYTDASAGWDRVARALLPFLEKLARSHGELADATASTAGHTTPDAANALAHTGIRKIEPAAADVTAATAAVSFAISPFSTPDHAAQFFGFAPLEGWCAREGPVPEAFLPPFHWSLAPATTLAVDADTEKTAQLTADVLTYSENQIIAFELNGAHLFQFSFTRTNQKERLATALPLRAGRNTLTIRYAQALRTEFDPRLLAAIFLSLQIR